MNLLGIKGENIAVKYLKASGFDIIERNYRTPFGEADIIGRENGVVVFVEVKSRSSDAFGQPFEAVDYRKREKLKKIAIYYLKQNKNDMPARFDVISILSGNGRDEINHIREAF